MIFTSAHENTDNYRIENPILGFPTVALLLIPCPEASGARALDGKTVPQA